MVEGSRPMRSQARCKTSMRSRATSGVPHVFHSWACSAVIAVMRGPPVPTRIGKGFWTGLGSQGASVIRK